MARHALALLVRRTPVAAAAALLSAAPSPPAAAQGAGEALPPVSVSGRALPPPEVSGWGAVPPERLPLAVNAFGAPELRDAGAQRLADLVNLDAGVADAYNAEGYWDILAIRGFTLDNRFNYRRDGLPINAETSIPLDNKARVELLKGTSGMQAGTSAPGGLVDLVVKRPLDVPLRSASLEWRERGNLSAAFDFSQRSGTDGAFGLRINGAAAHLAPPLRNADGSRGLFALAADGRLGGGALLEAEFEVSRRSQPSQPGFSLLGDGLPDPGDPRLNLNNQPWSLPVVFEGETASLRWQQPLGAGWKLVAHAMTQQLRSDDRVAFPFGCSAADGSYYADRYCPDGSFDLYDFRSDNERRRTDAAQLTLRGQARLAGLVHQLSAGVLHMRVRNRFDRLAFNFAGQGSIDGSVRTAPAPDLTGENTNRDERSTELQLRDAMALGADWTVWLGVRHTRLHRQSVQTDGSSPSDYAQSFTTPFGAVSWAFAKGQSLYVSAGRAVESEVAPNLDRYANAGQPLPALESRQAEVGWRGSVGAADWALTAFDIRRPIAADAGSCDLPGTCTRLIDGAARHRGVEASGKLRRGALTLHAAALWLRARREGSGTAASNGLVPPNVPSRSLRLGAEWRPAEPLELQAGLVYEGPRYVLPDNSVRLPGWTRVDAGIRVARGPVVWRLGVDNLSDRRAWRESPYQFAHAYLYPLAPRTVRLSAQIDF